MTEDDIPDEEPVEDWQRWCDLDTEPPPWRIERAAGRWPSDGSRFAFLRFTCGCQAGACDDIWTPTAWCAWHTPEEEN